MVASVMGAGVCVAEEAAEKVGVAVTLKTVVAVVVRGMFWSCDRIAVVIVSELVVSTKETL